MKLFKGLKDIFKKKVKKTGFLTGRAVFKPIIFNEGEIRTSVEVDHRLQFVDIISLNDDPKSTSLEPLRIFRGQTISGRINGVEKKYILVFYPAFKKNPWYLIEKTGTKRLRFHDFDSIAKFRGTL